MGQPPRLVISFFSGCHYFYFMFSLRFRSDKLFWLSSLLVLLYPLSGVHLNKQLFRFLDKTPSCRQTSFHVVIRNSPRRSKYAKCMVMEPFHRRILSFVDAVERKLAFHLNFKKFVLPCNFDFSSNSVWRFTSKVRGILST